MATTLLSAGITMGSSTLQPGGSAPSFACRAWVNFDGTGTFSPNPSTTKIRGSGNVSSILKNAGGDYTVNFTTAMQDTLYAMTGTAGGSESHPTVGVSIAHNIGPTTTTCRIYTTTTGGVGSLGFFFESFQTSFAFFR